MPILPPDELQRVVRDLFRATGMAEADAAWTARLLVRANLQGHDSHGVIRVPQYLAQWRAGLLDPRATPMVVAETAATALLDGRGGFGQVVARDALALAIRKAREVGLAAVGVRRAGHVGRLADYAEMAAAADMAAFLFVNASGAGQWMAPWGGREARLSTNPLAFACPGGAGRPVSLDIATTTAPEGKVRVKRSRREPAPPGWLLDADGRPTTDPEALYARPGGTLLPMAGHKGYGLAVLVEILAGILGRAGHARAAPAEDYNGLFAIVLDIARFLDPADFRAEVDALARYLRSSALAPGAAAVMVPGEPEAASEARRRVDGIFVEDATWEHILAATRELGVTPPGPRPA
jgi:uncharacterized oxidoreductase